MNGRRASVLLAGVLALGIAAAAARPADPAPVPGAAPLQLLPGEYLWLPELSPRVFRRCTQQHTGKAPLLAASNNANSKANLRQNALLSEGAALV